MFPPLSSHSNVSRRLSLTALLKEPPAKHPPPLAPAPARAISLLVRFDVEFMGSLPVQVLPITPPPLVQIELSRNPQVRPISPAVQIELGPHSHAQASKGTEVANAALKNIRALKKLQVLHHSISDRIPRLFTQMSLLLCVMPRHCC